MLEKHPGFRGLPWGNTWTCQARACGWPIRASIIIITSSSGQLPRLECYTVRTEYGVQLPRQTCRGSLTAFQRSPAQPGGKRCAFCFLSCSRVNFSLLDSSSPSSTRLLLSIRTACCCIVLKSFFFFLPPVESILDSCLDCLDVPPAQHGRPIQDLHPRAGQERRKH